MHECKPATETVVLTRSSVKVNQVKKRPMKRRKGRRIELSPPPVRRKNRLRRVRVANTETTQWTKDSAERSSPTTNVESEAETASNCDYFLSLNLQSNEGESNSQTNEGRSKQASESD